MQVIKLSPLAHILEVVGYLVFLLRYYPFSETYNLVIGKTALNIQFQRKKREGVSVISPPLSDMWGAMINGVDKIKETPVRIMQCNSTAPQATSSKIIV